MNYHKKQALTKISTGLALGLLSYIFALMAQELPSGDGVLGFWLGINSGFLLILSAFQIAKGIDSLNNL